MVCPDALQDTPSFPKISLTRFIENISSICIFKKIIIKIDLIIYLMILIMYYKY
jgi:hypothetical protein